MPPFNDSMPGFNFALNCPELMVEKSHTGKRHCNAVSVADTDNIVVAYRAAGFGNVRNAASAGTLNVVAEREKCVAAETYAGDGVKIRALFGFGEFVRAVLKIILPEPVVKNVLGKVRNVNVYRVVSVGTSESVQKGKFENLRVLAQMPVVGFVSGKARAVYS